MKFSVFYFHNFTLKFDINTERRNFVIKQSNGISSEKGHRKSTF